MTTINLTLNLSEKHDENTVKAVLKNIIQLREENPAVIGAPVEHGGNDVRQIEDFAAHADC